MRNKRGFSLLETTIVVAIFSLTASSFGSLFSNKFTNLSNAKTFAAAQSLATARWQEIYPSDFTTIHAETKHTDDTVNKLDRETVIVATDLGGGVTRKDITINVLKTGAATAIYSLSQTRTNLNNGIPPHTHQGNEVIANRNNSATDNGTAKELRWQNYGSNNTIVDASSSNYPGGNTNAQVAWSATYPTLMGFNGGNTYGVRVDSTRVADTAGSSTYAT